MNTTTQHTTKYKNLHLGLGFFFFAGFFEKTATCKALQRKINNPLIVFATVTQSTCKCFANKISLFCNSLVEYCLQLFLHKYNLLHT